MSRSEPDWRIARHDKERYSHSLVLLLRVRVQVALRDSAKDVIAIQFAYDAYLRRCGYMRKDEGKTDFLQQAVRHRVIGFRLANDTLQIEALVKVERRQAKEARAVALTAQISAPYVEMH